MQKLTRFEFFRAFARAQDSARAVSANPNDVFMEALKREEIAFEQLPEGVQQTIKEALARCDVRYWSAAYFVTAIEIAWRVYMAKTRPRRARLARWLFPDLV